MENLLYKDVSEFADLTEEERKNLNIVMEELKGWDHQDLNRVLSVMHENCVYHDITLPPAKGIPGVREFGEGWVTAAKDFSIFIEKFIVKGNIVVDVGRISGTITEPFFGHPAPNKPFDCMYCQVCVIEDGKIKYVRDHWDSYTMIQQMGWS